MGRGALGDEESQSRGRHPSNQNQNKSGNQHSSNPNNQNQNSQKHVSAKQTLSKLATKQPRISATEKAIEREVQRRVTEYLASAGLPQGQLSLQILFMLPKEFVDAYTELFAASLKELGRPGDGGRPANPVRSVQNVMLRDKDQSRGQREQKKIGVYDRGEKGYKEYWVIRNEAALKAKGSVDRKLQRIAGDIQRGLDKNFRDQS